MTISTQTSKAAFSGNGVSAVFPLPFPFQRAADIKALLRHDGFETPLAQGEHYGLTGAGSAAGGSLTMLVPPATGQTLVVWRAPALVQEVDYVENSAFPAETHEAALDLLTMICQSLQEQIGRAVLYPVSTPDEDVLNSEDFLAATTANKNAARASEQNAAASAGQAAASASQAAQSAAAIDEVAATMDGLVKVSGGDACGRSLSAKLLAGNGLAEGIENPGGDEALRLSVALAEESGLEFSAGLLRVKAGTGLVRSASGLAADVGATAGRLVQLDEAGHLPALDGRNLTNLPGGSAADLAAFHAFVAQIAASRATGPVPKGGIWLFTTDELTKANAYYSSSGRYYGNRDASTTTNSLTVGSLLGGASATTSLDLNSSLPAGQLSAVQIYMASPVNGAKVKVGRLVSGSSYSFVGESQVVNLVAGLNSIVLTTPIDVQSGDRLGLYLPTHYGPVSSTSSGSFCANNSDFTTTTGFTTYTGTLAMQGTVLTSTATNMALASPAGVALAAVPARATLYLLHKSIDALTYNTDIIVKASRGSGWATASDLAKVCSYDATYDLLKASIDLSALTSGTTGLWGLDTYNLKAQQVRAALALFE